MNCAHCELIRNEIVRFWVNNLFKMNKFLFDIKSIYLTI